MFQEEGFKIVEPFGKNNVVMSKEDLTCDGEMLG